jgi:hypothetical protein
VDFLLESGDATEDFTADAVRGAMAGGSDQLGSPSGGPTGSLLPTYFYDARSYFQGPWSFLSSQDLSGNEAVKKAVKTMALGAAGVIALSAVNLKLSPLGSDEKVGKLFEGTRTTTALVLGSVFDVALVHLIARLLRGLGRWRQTFVSFALTLGFTWPAAALALIILAWLSRLLTGLAWTALPPFDVELVGAAIENTLGNVLIVAALATLYVWVLGYLLYCYASAIRVAQQLTALRTGIALAILGSVDLFVSPIPRAMYGLAGIVDPLVQWLIKLL